MKKSTLPPPIMAAIAAMLQPYGIDPQQLFQAETAKTGRNEQKWLSPRDIEEQFSIGRWSIYRLIRKGEGCLKSVKLSSAKSGKVLVDADSLRRYLATKAYIPQSMNSIKSNNREREND